MYKLLEIVKLKCDADTIDVTLKFTLSTLWNLTDESPVTCEMFMNEGGLDIFICMLYKYRNADPEDRMQVGTVPGLWELGFERFCSNSTSLNNN